MKTVKIGRVVLSAGRTKCSAFDCCNANAAVGKYYVFFGLWGWKWTFGWKQMYRYFGLGPFRVGEEYIPF